MDGRAASWFQWMKANGLLTTWSLTSLLERFGSTLIDDREGALSKLSSVAEFQTAFEELMNKVTGIF